MYDADSETSLFDRPGVLNNKFDVLARLDPHIGGAGGGQLRRGSAPTSEASGSDTSSLKGLKVEGGAEGERTQQQQAVFQRVGQKVATSRGDAAGVKEATNKLGEMSLQDSGEQSAENTSSSGSRTRDGKRFITTATCENGNLGNGESGNDTDGETNKKFDPDSDEETNTKLGGPESTQTPPEELLNHMDAKDGDSDGDTNMNLSSKRQVRSNFVKGKIANFLKGGDDNNTATATATTGSKSSPPPPVIGDTNKEANKLGEATGGVAPTTSTTTTATPAVTHNSVSPPLSPRTKATTALTARYIAKHMECSVQSCLSQFTAPEWLTGANRFGCETCAKRQATGNDNVLIFWSNFDIQPFRVQVRI